MLSFKSVAMKHRVTYASWNCNKVFKVHTPNGVMKFKPSEQGLQYGDVLVEGDAVQHMLVTCNMTREDKEENDDLKEFEEVDKGEDANGNYVMVNTIQVNFKNHTRHKIKKAQEARRLQGMGDSPTE
jgi:hypothetical protein